MFKIISDILCIRCYKDDNVVHVYQIHPDPTNYGVVVIMIHISVYQLLTIKIWWRCFQQLNATNNVSVFICFPPIQRR